jgi:hypothetical protein
VIKANAQVAFHFAVSCLEHGIQIRLAQGAEIFQRGGFFNLELQSIAAQSDGALDGFCKEMIDHLILALSFRQA